MSKRLTYGILRAIVAGALAGSLALASPALARGGGGGGGGGHGGMGGGGGHGGMGGGGGHGMGGGGWGGGGHWGGGGMHFAAMSPHSSGGMGPRWSGGMGPRWSGGMGPRWSGGMGQRWSGGWHRAHFSRFAFRHHRFNRFAFFVGAPYYDYAYYDNCWRQVWTSFGPRLVNVCGDYGY
jgi:hypothetical protein